MINLLLLALYEQFINLLKENVNINKKMFSLMIHAGYEGSVHCRKNLHNPLESPGKAFYCLNIIKYIQGICDCTCNCFHPLADL